MMASAKRRAWKGMAVLAALALVSLVACGGGGGGDKDEDFDFNGTWVMDELVTQSNLPAFPVGMRGREVARITQSGTNITVVIDGVPPMSGACDPVAGTFAVAANDGAAALQMNGTKVDENTVSGAMSIAGGSALVQFSFTMELTSRNRTAGAGAAGGSLAAVLRTLK